jgi:hypothetical protein
VAAADGVRTNADRMVLMVLHCAGGVQGPPRVVCFIALSDLANASSGRDLLLSQAASVYQSPSSSVSATSVVNLCAICSAAGLLMFAGACLFHRLLEMQ